MKNRTKHKKKIWHRLFPHFVALITILTSNVIYFSPQFQNKEIIQTDFVSSMHRAAEREQFLKEGAEHQLWNNSLFAGMPDYYAGVAKKNYFGYVNEILTMGVEKPAGIFVGIMTMSYLAFVLFGFNPWLSLIISIAIGFSAGNMHLLVAGHNAKLRALSAVPLLISGFLLLFEKKKLILGTIVFSIGMGLNIYFNHPQMTYYTFLLFGLYLLLNARRIWQEQDRTHWVKAGVIMMLAIAGSLASSASKILPLAEYSEHSTRGKVILEKTSSSSDQGESTEAALESGLFWQQAMFHSNGWGDLMSTFIPRVVGGSSTEPMPTSKFGIGKGERYTFYWGNLPFTHGPIYFGAAFIFLFVFGALILRGPIQIWLVSSTCFVLLLSLGDQFSLLNRPLFDYLPLYNKFRAPSSILHVGFLFLPWLILPTLEEIIHKAAPKKSALQVTMPNIRLIESPHKSLQHTTFAMGGLALVFLLLGPLFSKYMSARDAEQAPEVVAQMVDVRQFLQRVDSARTLMFILATAALCYLLSHRKLSLRVWYVAFGAIILFDVVGVSTRYFSHRNFTKSTEYQDQFAAQPADQWMLDSFPNRYSYRVIDYSTNPFSSSQTSQFHNSLGGYHAAKLRRYDDVINNYLNNEHRGTVSMLNGKIVLQGQEGQKLIRRNRSALGNAWFVDSIQWVNSAREELGALDDLDPASTAVIYADEFRDYVERFQLGSDPNALIEISEYGPDRIAYRTSSSAPLLAVFSEIWYGPDLGWQAYIDDQPVAHIRANYILRSMVVPEGNHSIRFEFRPKSFYAGLRISQVSSTIMLMLILGLIIFPIYQQKFSK